MTPMTSALVVTAAAGSGFGSGVFGVVVAVFVIGEAPSAIGLGEDQQSDDQHQDQHAQNAAYDNADGVGGQIAVVVRFLNSEFH